MDYLCPVWGSKSLQVCDWILLDIYKYFISIDISNMVEIFQDLLFSFTFYGQFGFLYKSARIQHEKSVLDNLQFEYYLVKQYASSWFSLFIRYIVFPHWLNMGFRFCFSFFSFLGLSLIIQLWSMKRCEWIINRNGFWLAASSCFFLMFHILQFNMVLESHDMVQILYVRNWCMEEFREPIQMVRDVWFSPVNLQSVWGW